MEGALWYLKRCDLFERLTPEQADRLNRRALVRQYKRNALIYSPTEPGQTVMVLAEGRIKIKDITPDGKETILAFIEEGELFGELALLDEGARQEYAEAAVDSRVLVLPREDLLWLMESRPELALSITKLIGLRRRRIENRLRNVLFLSSRERLVRILLELQESHGERYCNRCEIRLPLSHQDLASLIGVTRETVTVVLGELQRDGLIRVQRRRVTVTDCRRLAELGNGILPVRAPPPRHPTARPPRRL
ncbi:MAG: Crp/Fnr family transcriptional regulator [Planctomycetes bacterium]|nr:Crp/Fnr family transcriptional regulator [Planctomycetota bacterium]